MKTCLVKAPNLEEAISSLESEGFSLVSIFPAEDPSSAFLKNDKVAIRLVRDKFARKSLLHDRSSWEEVKNDKFAPRLELPAFSIKNRVYAKDTQRVTDGRASMQYRDLFEDRLGGLLIGSRISIPGEGPVKDYVHFHRLYFQILYCLRGSATLVYEGQGEPFRFTEGDLILQPPLLRHQVLESHNDLEVLEFSCPAEHETIRDHSIELPTESKELEEAGSQDFVNEHLFGKSELINRASRGILDVRLIELKEGENFNQTENNLSVGYQILGNAQIKTVENHAVQEGDSFCFASAFTIDAITKSRLVVVSVDLEHLHEFSESSA